MNQGDTSSSGLIEFGIWTAVLLGLCFGLWWIFRPYIMWFSFYTSFFVFKHIYTHLSFLMTDHQYETLINALKNIPHISPKRYGIEALYRLFEIHGFVLRWPVSIGMIYLGWVVKKGVVRFKYRREIKNVYDLIDIQAEHFPASKIIQGKNLLSMHLYDGPWRTYAIPVDFALDFNLLWTHKGANTSILDPAMPVNEKEMIPIPPFTKDEKLKEFSWKRRALPHYRYTALNLARANKLFASQLGSLWKGSSALPPMERGLYAAFCAQAAGNGAEAIELINQMAFSWVEATYDTNWNPITPHHCDTTGADELIAKYESHEDIQRVIQTHAHSYNVLYGVLHLARSNGRLFHANFGWLRPVNRQLFILLCSHGGQCSYWEVAGLWAHYQIEEQMGKRLIKPMVFSAVYAFHDTLSKEHWIDPGEYSEDAQRREVESANKIIRDANDASKGAVSSTGFSAPQRSTPAKGANTNSRGDHGDDVP
ncbi:hypothetical protein ACEN2T_17450 [Pseudomonas sp. W22_MBD1_FP4]|uniref:secretion/conjugation apparatus DotM-related subunit n=1 Tax=Pseudomonas sp. W22_MBD1_FP4 TaxID=3240272 RepID=UPI003F997135